MIAKISPRHVIIGDRISFLKDGDSYYEVSSIHPSGEIYGHFVCGDFHDDTECYVLNFNEPLREDLWRISTNEQLRASTWEAGYEAALQDMERFAQRMRSLAE